MSDDRGGRRTEVGGREDRFDRAIDGAVREMLDVEPPAGLRARVVSKLETPVASAFGWKIWIAVPLAAAAVLILAVTLSRRVETPVQPPVIAHGADQYLPPEVAAPTPSIAQRPATALAPAAVRVNTGQGTVLATALVPATESARSDIEPLKTIPPIDIAALGQRSIAPTDITVTPLAPITEMQIAPLTPPDRRN